jgi:hypothetical protein
VGAVDNLGWLAQVKPFLINGETLEEGNAQEDYLLTINWQNIKIWI